MRQRALLVTLSLAAVFSCLLLAAGPATAQDPPGAPAAGTAGAVPSPLPSITPASGRAEDLKAATDAWLATVPAADRARSDAYFEGGYWLLLWDFLIGLAVGALLLVTGLSARMRDLAFRVSRFSPVRTFVYWLQYMLFVLVITFPMGVYEAYFREKKYGLMNLSFGGWFNEYLVGNAVGLVMGGIAVTALFGIVRKLPRTWWLWGTAFSLAFLAFAMLIGPVWIAPLFNEYKKLADPQVRDPILSLARANGVPATDVYEFDASKQSKRVSANVSGFLGTERVSLNDNLLNRCTPAEIRAVMAHEIGHYVLNHVWKMLLWFTLVILAFFGYLRWALGAVLARRGERWGIRDVGDPAVLPLVVVLASLFFFVLTPLNNTFIRVQEAEADLFGLNAAREPEAEARVDLMLGEYRKLDPGPLEEILFFDHPSGRSRILMAMRWKAEHLLPEPGHLPEPGAGLR